MAPNQRVPVIDLAPYINGSMEGKLQVAQQVGSACEDLGFLVVSSHGVPLELIDAMHGIYKQFFGLPLEAKMEWAIGKHSPFAGYIHQGNSYLAKTAKLNKGKSQVHHDTDKDESSAPDLKESFGIGPPVFPQEEDYYTCERGQKYYRPTPWPESPLMPDLRETLEGVAVRYWEHMEELTLQLMGAMALALHLPEDYFVPFLDRHISHLFVQHYPVQSQPPKPGQIRAGAHTDFGGVTILHLGSNPEGLEVFERRKRGAAGAAPDAANGEAGAEGGEDEEGEWTPVSAPMDCFVVNLGDLMQQWTNDVWKSTLHRVVNPPGQPRASSVRQTITYFSQPNYDAVIECIPTLLAQGEKPKYAPMTSGDHYDMKLSVMREAYNKV